MNSLDLVLLVILTLFALKGALRGLLREVCSLVGLLAATLVASSFYAPLASQLQQIPPGCR
ncbi:MAG: CvpA family protein [Clostridia bacterium]|nr:CvpA family protein [Clostridia bacterium]